MALKFKYFLFVVLFISGSFHLQAQNIDLNILKSINPQNPNNNFWVQTSNSVYWVPATVTFGSLATGFIKKDKKLQQRSYELLISIGSATLVSEIMKTSFNRQRPAEKFPNEVFEYNSSTGRSFPSGHTTLAFATATTIALQYKKWYITVPAYLWAASVGYSRMYLGRHYPSDVLAGVVIGIGGGYFSHWLSKKIFRKHN